MANYYATCRTNYFKVKNKDAFLADMEDIPNIIVDSDDGENFYILGDDPDGGGWPFITFDDDTGKDIEIDIVGSVAKHLADDAVAIFMEVGNEKARYVIGCAIAVNNKGEQEIINLSDIYDIAKRKLTSNPEGVTVAEY